MQQQALSAIVAWIRLERAMEKFNLDLKQQFGLTGLQLAVLRILAERPQLPLAALRKTLVMHPATLGQSIDELRLKGLCTVKRDAKDKRARLVAITPEGAELVRDRDLDGARHSTAIRFPMTRASPSEANRAATEIAIEISVSRSAPASPPGTWVKV